ncbi:MULTISPECIES: hypothetical protein [Pseudofrankia]|nr:MULTISPECIES: hypothetical protein [Pseudofrankia]
MASLSAEQPKAPPRGRRRARLVVRLRYWTSAGALFGCRARTTGVTEP